MRARYAIVIILVTLSLISSKVNAEEQFWINTYGINWSSNTVNIVIPTTPSSLHDLTLQAVKIWNEEQVWFQKTYFPSGQLTILNPAQSGPVAVKLASVSEMQKYCNTTKPDLDGCTIRSWILETLLFKSTTVYLNQNLARVGIYLVLHEFGHVLGLPDYPDPCPFSDLMCYHPIGFPSTLDLYAIHLLSQGANPTKVILPSNIPYQPSPPLAVPEFPVTPIIIFSCMSMAVLQLTNRRKVTGRPN